MVGTGDTGVYIGSGLQRVIPYVQFKLLMFLCLNVCSRVTNWSGEGFEAQVPKCVWFVKPEGVRVLQHA
jgi:hypothetical protein